MKVFAIFTYGSDDCRMLVNSTDCSSAVHLALTKTDISSVTYDELQACEIDGLSYKDDIGCVITTFGNVSEIFEEL